MKVVHILFALMFLVFAGLQYNDPDPILWMPVYLAMVVVCILASLGKFYQRVNYLLIAGYVLFSLIYIPGVIDWLRSPDPMLLFSEVAKMDYIYIEETREFMGLMICVVVLLWYISLAKKQATVVETSSVKSTE